MVLPLRNFVYLKEGLFQEDNKGANIRNSPPLYRIGPTARAGRPTIGDVAVRVTIMGVPYVLVEAAPGSLPSLEHLTAGYTLHHVEDRCGMHGISREHLDFLARNGAVLVQTLPIGQTLPPCPHGYSTVVQQPYPAALPTDPSHDLSHERNQERTPRAPKRRKKFTGLPPPIPSDQESKFSHNVPKGRESSNIDRSAHGMGRFRGRDAEEQLSRSSSIETNHSEERRRKLMSPSPESKERYSRVETRPIHLRPASPTPSILANRSDEDLDSTYDDEGDDESLANNGPNSTPEDMHGVRNVTMDSKAPPTLWNWRPGE